MHYWSILILFCHWLNKMKLKHIHTHMRSCKHTCLHTHTHTHMHACTHTYACMHAHTHTHRHIHKHCIHTLCCDLPYFGVQKFDRELPQRCTKVCICGSLGDFAATTVVEVQSAQTLQLIGHSTVHCSSRPLLLKNKTVTSVLYI